MKKLLVLWLFLTGVGYADSSPVKVTKAWIFNKFLRVSYQNVSDKDIQAIKFKAVYYDAVGDPHSPYADFTDNERLKVGKSRKSMWDERLYDGTHTPKVTPAKVVFTDKTVWEAEKE